MLTNYEAKILLDSELQSLADKKPSQKRQNDGLLDKFRGLLVESKRPSPEVVAYLKNLGLDKLEILQILNNFERLNSAMVYLIIEDCEDKLASAEQGLDVEKFLIKLKSLKG